MIRRFILSCSLALAAGTLSGLASDPDDLDINAPPHLYRQRVPEDRFTALITAFESGRILLDRSTEKQFLYSLLKVLDIPVASQLLVFSTTSLQLGLISPATPRAIYFTEDLYVGNVPNGRIEIVSLDPELGGVFYIFDIPKTSQPVKIERSNRCMNCHAGEETQFIPGLTLKSVVPGPSGGSLAAFRQNQTGHGIPFEQRFGGWYVTGRHGITNHWGNLTGRLSPDGLSKHPVEPGQRFDFERYPAGTSDILAHLLLEHQAGFVNRAVEAAYWVRSYLYSDQDHLTAPHAAELERHAEIIVRYLLFADEPSWPAGGIDGDAAFKSEFMRNRRIGSNGLSLKDLDLETRLFRHRCSYMVYSPTFTRLPAPLKRRIYEKLQDALRVENGTAAYAYLPAAEKSSIRSILAGTLSDLPAGW